MLRSPSAVVIPHPSRLARLLGGAVLAAALLGGCAAAPAAAGDGISFPQPPLPSFAAATVALRCAPADRRCVDRAQQLATIVAANLAGPWDGPGVRDTSGTPLAGTFLVVVERASPLGWAAVVDGTTLRGTTRRMVVDLAGAVPDPAGTSYAVVDSGAGPRRFIVPPGLASQMLAALYRHLGPYANQPGVE